MGVMDDYYKKKKELEEEAARKNGKRSVMDDYYAKMQEFGVDYEDIAPVRPATSGDEKRTWFRSGLFEDGYDFGDVTKTILGTTTDITEDITAGALGIVESTIDTAAYLAGGVGGLFGADGFRDKTQDFIKKDIIDEQALAKYGSSPVGVISNLILGGKVEEASLLGDKSDSLVQSGGQLLATFGLQGLGVPWWLTSGVTSFGSSAEGALNEGATYGEAGMSAAINAGAELLTEKLFGGSGLGEKGLINLEPLTKGISSKFFKALADWGVDVGAEGVEEVVSQFASNLSSALYKEEQVGDLLFSEEAIDGYIESFIGGSVLGGGMNVGKLNTSIKTGRDYRTELTDNEQKVVDRVFNDRVAEAEKGGKKLTEKEKNHIHEEVIEDMVNGGIDIDTIEEVLGGDSYIAYRDSAKQYDDAVAEEKALREEYNGLMNLKKNELTGNQEKRIAELETLLADTSKRDGLKKDRDLFGSKLAQDVFGIAKGDRLGNSYRGISEDFTPDFDKYKGTKYEDAARKTLESATKASMGGTKLSNNYKTRTFVDFLAKISSETGKVFDLRSYEQIQADFVEMQTSRIKELEGIPEAGRTAEQNEKIAQIKDMIAKVRSGKVTVNGNIVGGNITININSEDAMTRTVGHEVTHTFEPEKGAKESKEYTELRDALFQYAKSKGVDIEAEIEARKLRYEGVDGADPQAELVADLVGKYLFTDKAFISNLSTNHRNIFQKMWDKVKYLCKMATAGSKEARQLERVKKAFEDAYRESGKNAEASNSDGDVQYSIVENYDYDGLVLDEGADGGYGDDVVSRGQSYVVFSPEQVKNVDNLNPTSDPDIRYSLSDSAGKALSDEQVEYFKDSKVVDSKGRLKKVYHGTTAQFNTFNRGDIGYHFGNKTTARTRVGRGKNTRLIECYLNITNPIEFDYDLGSWDADYRLTEDLVERNIITQEEARSVLLTDDGRHRRTTGNANNKLRELLLSKGYDGITYSNHFESKGSTSYIALKPEQIKSVDNVSPTSDPDIRFSLSEDAERVFYTPRGVEVVQNPTDAEYRQMREDVYKEYPWLRGTGEAILRHTYDESGNEYYWNAFEGMHMDVEPYINKRYNTRTSQQWNWWTREDKDYYPTDYSDIRFSLSESVEETKDLIAVHNLTPDKLLKSMKMGGFPMPSIAIVKEAHDDFGNISVIFTKDTIDPKAQKANKVYSGDAWTPTYPKLEYEADGNVERRIHQKLDSLASKVDDFFRDDLIGLKHGYEDTLNFYGGEENLVRQMIGNYGLKAAYLEEQGHHVEKVTIRQEIPKKFDPAHVGEYQKVMSVLGVNTSEEISKLDLKKVKEQHGAELESAYPGITKSLLRMSGVFKRIKAYLESKNTGTEYTTVTDADGTRKAVDAALDVEGFEKWLSDLFRGIEGKSGIRNNKDLFTPSGNRRSFDALHYVHNLENVVKAMKQAGTQGIGFGGGNIFGASATEYRSIKDIKKASDRLQRISDEEYQAIKDGFTERFRELASSLPKNKDSWTATDDAANMLVEAVIKGKTRKGMADYLRAECEGWANYSDSVVDDLIELVTDIRNMPTSYFEAKPQRAVGFDEVAAVVIPSDSDVKLKQELLNNGFSIAEYDPKVDGDRQRVVNQFEQYKFSLSDANEVRTAEGGYGVYGRDLVQDNRLAPLPDVAPTPAPQVTPVSDADEADEADIAPVGEEGATPDKPSSIVLYNKRDGKDGWGDAYGTAQEALNDAVRYVNGELWDAFNAEVNKWKDRGQIPRGGTPIIDALIAVQEDVRQVTITPMQGAKLLSEAYSQGGVDALRRMVNPRDGNLYNKYLEQAKQYDTTPPTGADQFPDDIAPMSDAEVSANPRDRLDSLTDDDAPPEMDAPMAMSDTTDMPQNAVSWIAQNVRSALRLSNSQMADVHNIIREYSTSEFPDRNQLFWKVKEKLGEYTETHTDEGVKEIKAQLRKYGLFVSDAIKSDIADYNDLRRSNFGKIRFSNQGVPVDVAYDELSDKHQSLFPKSITNPTDQLLRIIEVANMDATVSEVRAVDDDSIWEAVDAIIEGVGDYQLNQREKFSDQSAGASFDSLMENADQYAPAEDFDAPIAEEVPAAPVPKADAPTPKQPKAGKPGSNTDGKQRKWVGTSTESDAVDGKVIPDDLNQDLIHYQPISNRKTLGNANMKLDMMGYDSAVTYLNSQFASRSVSLDDIALGERLIQEAVKRGDTKTAGELITDISILGTELGQKVQALSIIKRLTPEGQLRMLKRTVERGKVKGDKAFEGVEISQDMIDHILKVYGKDGTYDQAELNKRVEEVKQQIADQMQVTAMDYINEWRYLAMLGNPKTHIRNIVSNIAMKGTAAVKNAVARTIEDIAPVKGRTKTWARATDDVRNFAKQETAAVFSESTDSKYSDGGSIKAKRRIFKADIVNRAAEFNSNALSAEDAYFSRPAYQNALSEFLTANGIRTKADIENNRKIVEKAKQYAMKLAKEATFQQDSYIASKIHEIERKNPLLNIAIGAVLPFKKTPINIAKTAAAYSPLGFARNIYDAVQVSKGQMETSEAVDHLAQTLTGTSLTLIGYALASSGILNGAGDDDKEGEYDYQLGKQSYSFNFNGDTFSLSWLSPVAMPLFVGANAYEQLVEDRDWDWNVVSEALAQTLDPLSEMSFLSSLSDVLSSYDDGMAAFGGMIESAGQSYITSLVPTLSSQIAQLTDDTKRSTKVSGNSGFDFGEETWNRIKYKIPGLRQTLEPSTDIWGNEIKQDGNLLTKGFESFLAPYARREDIATAVDDELKELYRQTGDTGLIPSIPDNYISYDGVKYDMSASEFTDFKKAYGQTAYDYMERLFRTRTYREADSETRAEMVNRVYDLARDEARKGYLAGQGVRFTNATEDGEEYYRENPIKGAIESDLPVDEYTFSTKYPEKYSFFKQNGISYSDYDSADEDGKRAYTWAYENPGKYTMSKAISDDFMVYYQHRSALYDLKADKDAYGNTISGSKKEKVLDYINNSDLDYGQRIILYRSMYSSKQDKSDYNNDIIDYLNSRQDISYEDMVTILEELDMKVDENGYITW